jgi:hypothetical protein
MAYYILVYPKIFLLKRGFDKFYDICYDWQIAIDVGTRLIANGVDFG